jgi:hypothetical protein
MTSRSQGRVSSPRLLKTPKDWGHLRPLRTVAQAVCSAPVTAGTVGCRSGPPFTRTVGMLITLTCVTGSSSGRRSRPSAARGWPAWRRARARPPGQFHQPVIGHAGRSRRGLVCEQQPPVRHEHRRTDDRGGVEGVRRAAGVPLPRGRVQQRGHVITDLHPAGTDPAVTASAQSRSRAASRAWPVRCHRGRVTLSGPVSSRGWARRWPPGVAAR